MKKLILLLILTISFIEAQDKSIEVYAKVSEESVRFKWIPKEYTSSNSYKLYRNDVLIASLKPKAYEDLVREKYSEDYIHVIYPFRNVKNLDDQILAFKSEQQVGGFRVLRLMQDNTFAKNLGQFYEDKIQKSDGKINYRLELFKNQKKIASKHIVIESQKISSLDKVSIVYAKGDSDGVSLNWDSKNSYAFYNVYRKLENETTFTKITKTPIYKSPAQSTKGSVPFVDKELQKGQKAWYYVTKLDMFYEESEPSKEVQAQRFLYQKPPVVKNIFVKNSDKKITLRWEKISNIDGYNVYRSMNYNGGYQKINEAPIKEEAYFDKDFKVGQNYYYYITSINKHGESFASVKMLAYAKDASSPSIPQNCNYEIQPNGISLSWDENKEDDLLGYRVYMSMEENATTWSLINKEVIQTTKFVHERPKTLSRNFYFYHIKAVDKSFNESAMSKILRVKLPDVTAPKQPVLLKSMSYPSKITLEWGKTLVYDFSHYNVYKKDGTKCNKEPLLRNYFEDKNPQIGENHYIITAVDISGNESPKQRVDTIVLQDTTPLHVENFILKKDDKGVQITFTCKDEEYSGFELLRSSGNDSKYYNISNFQTTKSFMDTSVSKNTNYFYMLKVYDKIGNITQSDVVSIRYE